MLPTTVYLLLVMLTTIGDDASVAGSVFTPMGVYPTKGDCQAAGAKMHNGPDQMTYCLYIKIPQYNKQ